MVLLRQRINPIPAGGEGVVEAKAVVEGVQPKVVYKFFVVVFVVVRKVLENGRISYKCAHFEFLMTAYFNEYLFNKNSIFTIFWQHRQYKIMDFPITN